MRNLSRSITAAGILAMALSANAAAQEKKEWWEVKLLPDPFSLTLTFTTDYRFRGISQTSLAPGYQANFDFEQEIFKEPSISIYAGVFASNVRFFRATSEVDAYGGFKGKVLERLSWNVQFIGYLYPGAPGSLGYNYFEVIPALGWDFGFAELSGGVALSPNYFAKSGFGAYPYVDLKVPLPIDALAKFKPAVVGHVGYQAIERNERFGTPDYWDWNIGLAASVLGFNMSIKYVDTNLSRAQCAGTTLCRAGAIFTISRTF